MKRLERNGVPFWRGVKYWSKSDLDGGLAFALFRKSEMPEPTIEAAIDIAGFGPALYGGVGRYFESAPSGYENDFHIIVYQRFGYDC